MYDNFYKENSGPLEPEAQELVDKEAEAIIKRHKKDQNSFWRGSRNRDAWRRMQRHRDKSNAGIQKLMNLVRHSVPVLDAELLILREEKKHFPRGHETIYHNEWS